MQSDIICKDRNCSLDIIKIMAALFVVFLHIDGFTTIEKPLDFYGSSVRILYYTIEAICYPAIHLFVMAGSYLMLNKKRNLRGIIRIYLQTFL